MNNEFGLKELYEVSLKATYPIEVGGRTIQPGEKIAVFDKLLIANFAENKQFFSAKGGFDNRSHIWWEETKEIRVYITQGVFSKAHLALMTNAQLTNSEMGEGLLISKREIVESNDLNKAYVKHDISKPVFVYSKETGEKIENFTFEKNCITLEKPYIEIIVDYHYDYDKNFQVITFGRALTNGFLSLEGRTRVKDDTTGQVKTGIIKIPKLKLLSDLSMRLGKDATPQVGRIDAVALPVGVKGQKRVMELFFLEEDIDSDI